jgi:GTP-binding protein LepA
MPSIRNFCIIAHIDHGKSTLADRMLELTHTVAARDMRKQLLDTMELEQERGITIKLQPVQMQWREHQLNLIDTPGHVDFYYEVSRSLAACEGAVLVVDATQGIQAQTLANVYTAIEAGLKVIPVINKIDLPAAEPEKVTGEVATLLGCLPEEVLAVSAKQGTGVEQLLDRIVEVVPPPRGGDGALRALIFDSFYDEYRGVILYLRIVDGQLATGDNLLLMSNRQDGQALEVGIFKPKQTPVEALGSGQIGYCVTNLKSITAARVGDTITIKNNPAQAALPGYRQVKPFVYAGFFPQTAEQYPALKDALAKLQLNDAALTYDPENSQILGFGFRVGFLGLLHLDIVKERLEREYGLDLVVTSPSTDYVIMKTTGEEITIRSAAQLPDPASIAEIREPWIRGEIVVPTQYLGGVMQLVNNVRGRQKSLSYLDEELAVMSFEAPLANILTDFYDHLKSLTSGYGSFNYEPSDYRAEKLVRLDILVGGELVDSISQIVHREEAYRAGKEVIAKLKDIIPRQLFEVTLQAAIGGKIIAREDVKALGKNVTAKLYGGDVSRKRKLLEKQKAGKKRLKKIGKVEIPPEAFAVLVKKE